MAMPHKSTQPLFRVSLKAVIFNDKGEVLLVKEGSRDWWDIPGGGMEHGETLKDALARELYEEVSLEGDFAFETLIAEDARHQPAHDLYQMRITFLVTPKSLTFAAGSDAAEVAFFDPDMFKNSAIWTEQKIYEYCQLAKERLSGR